MILFQLFIELIILINSVLVFSLVRIKLKKSLKKNQSFVYNFKAYKYKFIPNDDLFVPCPGEEDISHYQVLEHNITTQRTDDDVLMVGGFGKWIYKGDFRGLPVKVRYEFH